MCTYPRACYGVTDRQVVAGKCCDARSVTRSTYVRLTNFRCALTALSPVNGRAISAQEVSRLRMSPPAIKRTSGRSPDGGRGRRARAARAKARSQVGALGMRAASTWSEHRNVRTAAIRRSALVRSRVAPRCAPPSSHVQRGDLQQPYPQSRGT